MNSQFVKCPTCNQPNNVEDEYCSNCGNRLDDLDVSDIQDYTP